ncbi:putative inner membrane protein [compost metagenome]
MKQVLAAILGGLLMGYGARLANGCNIGALFTSISSLSLSGWIFWLFLLAGAFIGSKLLAKFFM